MKRNIAKALVLTLGLVFAFWLGWHIGHTRPINHNLRLLREATGEDDEGLKKMWADVRQMTRDLEADQEIAVAIALKALSAILDGEQAKAEETLAIPIAFVYAERLAGNSDATLGEEDRALKERIEALLPRSASLRRKMSQRNDTERAAPADAESRR